jgi:hypothetical protein
MRWNVAPAETRKQRVERWCTKCIILLLLAMARSLLILIEMLPPRLGKQYPEQRLLCWESSSPRPSGNPTTLQRTPLPHTVAARATDYSRLTTSTSSVLCATGDGGILAFVGGCSADPHHHGVAKFS